MKINEVTAPSEATITEAIDATNTSGFLTEDLVGVVKAHQADQWQSHDADSYVKSLLEGKLPWAAN